MLTNILKYFEYYDNQKAPFMHKQWQDWRDTQPLLGLKVLHHVPVVPNTLLKIACLVAAGAEVVVTNPSFLPANLAAVNALAADGVTYVSDLNQLRGVEFDIYFDCCAELYQALGRPKIGAIELTASGHQYYCAQQLDFPVVSVDQTLTKQLETLFGSAVSAQTSIAQLTGLDVAKQSWLIIGFGKIGRGLGYFCVKHGAPVTIVDINPAARLAAQILGINAIDPADLVAMQAAFAAADIVITATGQTAAVAAYPKEWFAGKVLANMGVSDEYGEHFSKTEVLNQKLPVNFVLDDPTPMEFIDPEFFAHNIAALELLKHNLPNGVNDLTAASDRAIIDSWCQYHQASREQINRWFIQ